VPQRLDERPLAVDGLVQQVRVQPAGALDGPRPQPLDDVPRLAEAGRFRRAHPGALRVLPVELSLDQWADVDAVDPDVEDVAVEVDVVQIDATHHHVAHPHGLEL
jgi:hypothetical protein